VTAAAVAAALVVLATLVAMLPPGLRRPAPVPLRATATGRRRTGR
jgi:hypothetical protein